MTDILADFTNRTIFANGDLATGNSDLQHQQLLLISEKGSFKEFPATGVGAATYLESENIDDLLREVRTQFTADGMDVRAVQYKNGKLQFDARY